MHIYIQQQFFFEKLIVFEQRKRERKKGWKTKGGGGVRNINHIKKTHSSKSKILFLRQSGSD